MKEFVGEKPAWKEWYGTTFTLAIESELYAPNDAIKGTFQIFGETKKVREWTLKRITENLQTALAGF